MTPIDKFKNLNFDNKESLSRKMKTIQSIGTFNQTPEQIDRSFVIHQKSQVFNKPFILEDKQKDNISTSNISKLSKIQGELSDISKMKNMYQSRLQKDRFKNTSSNKSIQKYSAGKSAEKHILKPTNTPSFNKFQSKKLINSRQIQQNQRPKGNQKSIVFMKNIQTQQINQNEGLQLTTRNDDDFQYQFYPQSSAKRRRTDNLSQIQNSSKRQNLAKKINFEQTKKDLELSDIKIENLNNKHEYTQSKSIHFKCQCDKKMETFVQEVNAKLVQAFQRIRKLQEKNIEAQKRTEQLQRLNQQKQEQIQQILEQKQKIEENEQKCRLQKQQLELMLKDVLFKRERQRLQQSKQNSHRHSNSQSEYLYSNQNTPPANYIEYNKKSPIKFQKGGNKQKNNQTRTLEQRNIVQKKDSKLNSDNRIKNQNKNRIQSLLQKLQINVQRI